jgi:hypothetical protein
MRLVALPRVYQRSIVEEMRPCMYNRDKTQTCKRAVIVCEAVTHSQLGGVAVLHI